MPHDSADQIFEEFQDIVQQGILRGFPNAERNGCPGSAVLEELANRPQPRRDVGWEHVTHCSPCYREFLDIRTQVKQRRELERRRALWRRVAVAASMILLGGSAIATYEVLQRNAGPARSEQSSPYQSASLDLKDRSVARSVEGQNTKTQPLVLPGKHLDLTIFLPIGSEPGRYEVKLLKKIDEPLLSFSGEAIVDRGTTVLRAKLDLTGQGAGSFLIGLRQPPSDWTYYPVTVR